MKTQTFVLKGGSDFFDMSQCLFLPHLYFSVFPIRSCWFDRTWIFSFQRALSVDKLAWQKEWSPFATSTTRQIKAYLY